MAKRGLACVICTSWLEAAGLTGKWPAAGKDPEGNGAGLHAARVLAAWSARGNLISVEKVCRPCHKLWTVPTLAPSTFVHVADTALSNL